MKSLLTFLFLFASLLAGFGQTIEYYKAGTDGTTQKVYAIYSDGSQKLVSTLPSDAVFARKGGIVRLPYAPEPKRVFNPQQFGLNKYFSDNFRLSMDYNPGGLSPTQRKAFGVNLFNFWSISDTEKANAPPGSGMLYLTESGVHGSLEGAGFFESDLQTYYNQIWNALPGAGNGANPGAKYVIFNIEVSNDWSRGYYAGNDSKWPSWESRKDKRIICESDGVERSLEQIDQQNLWSVEASVRRANRLVLLLKVLKEKSAPGTLVSYGASMHQALPRKDFATNNNYFLPGTCNVNFIPGHSGNTVTLNKPGGGTGTYTLTGNQYSNEDFMTGYYYLFDKDLAQSDYNDIFVNKVAGKTNYPYLWSKLLIRHVVADEKGYIQENRRLMQAVLGSKHPIMRMQEPQFEGDGIGLYDANGNFTSYVQSRITWDSLQTNITGEEPPKVHQPPYMNYSRFMVTRFFAGDEPGWGYYVFPPGNPNWVRLPLASVPQFNHHWHGMTAIIQARHDLQPYEKWFAGSTLIEDPEVQINAVGAFTAYNGVEAYNYDAGVQGVQKPAYMMRYKTQPNGDIRVLILGGMNQDWTAERVDIVRAPGGALGGNKFKVKLIGPAAQVYEFVVKAGDSNQTYDAQPSRNPQWEKAGYAGRVGVVTSTTGSTGTSCDYSVTTNNITLGCGVTGTLTASVSGTAASGLTYNWTGPGFSASSQNPSFTPTNVNGVYSYTVSVSKSGCTPKTAVSNVTVSGCGSGNSSIAYNKPSFDTFDYSVPTAGTHNVWPFFDSRLHRNVPIGDKVVLENGSIRVEIWKNFGGAVAHVSFPGGQNIVNQNDWGRGVGMTIYRGGRTRQIESQNKEIQSQWATAEGAGVGNNPIQIGDTFDNPAVVVDMWYTSTTCYTKSVMMNWAVRNDPTDVVLEQWVSISGAVCDVHVKMTHNRVNDQTKYEAKSNEYPNTIVNAPYKYNAHVDGNGNITYLTNWNQTPVSMGQNWYAMVPDASPASSGLGVWRAGCFQTSQNRYAPDDTASDEFANPANYGVANQSMIWDWNGTYYDNYKLMVGQVQQIKAWANSLPDPRNTFKWKFNSRNGRGYYTYGNGIDTGYPTPDDGIELQVKNPSTNFVDFHFPHVGLVASSVSNVYVRYKATSDWPSSLLVSGGRTGQTDIQIAGQNITVNLTCDNAWHTLTIPVSTISGWSGTIYDLHTTSFNVPSSARLKIGWVNTANTDPEP
ncbi:hypothetical protein [Spirosoma sp. 48-14]|uniref:hypothetical protein n=1 Tax=Spirosoma sp. 48-14 TaxID=1895854 RepID=UPI00095C3FF1|nr:hypothetical protein [Spirosoma sp. 48-14]OJW78459.1 MAG: hypothetical protein BGO59_31135 [Spirosoma sp. 48-14]